MPIHPELLDILVCPQCKGSLCLTEKQDGLICDACALMYEIRDDIPIMLVEEAKPVAAPH
ncbi:Trm112 family protein [Desulfosarcina sp. OttesenSCG-928-B08]|nr:Trm112 family protein [Desulfosarcina sp. OttesenSCG-928-B08]